MENNFRSFVGWLQHNWVTGYFEKECIYWFWFELPLQCRFTTFSFSLVFLLISIFPICDPSKDFFLFTSQFLFFVVSPKAYKFKLL